MPVAKAAKYGYINARCHAVRSGMLGERQLQELAASGSLAAFVSLLGPTPYGAFVQSASIESVHAGLDSAFAYRRDHLLKGLDARYRRLFELFFTVKYALADTKAEAADAGNAETVFQRIDRDYIGELKKNMRMLPPSERRQLHRIVGSYFDLLNLFNIVKLRLLYRKNAEEILALMLPYADRITRDVQVRLCAVRGLDELSAETAPLFGRGFDDFETFRKTVYLHHRARMLTVWNGYPFSIAIPFSLLRLIEMEIADLRAIAEGISFHLGAEAIASMMTGS